jgi:hypothetical protein
MFNGLVTQLNSYLRRKLMEVFDTNASGETVVRTSGESRVSGLNEEGRVTVVELVDSEWRRLPPTPLAGANAISIQNNSGTTILLNYVDTVGVTDGVLIKNGQDRFYDINNDDIPIYGRSIGGTVNVIIEELK